MKPVEPRHESDCVANAIAALLELPIEEVPDFWTSSTDAVSMSEQVRRWLAARGWHWYYSTCTPIQLGVLRRLPRERGNTWPPRGYWLGHLSTVEALRDREPSHLVVMRDRLLVFNPGGKVADGYDPTWWLLGYYLLVPLDPVAGELAFEGLRAEYHRATGHWPESPGS